MPLAGLRTAVLGAGGAARAVAVALGIQRRDRDAARAQRSAGEPRVACRHGDVGPWPPAAGSWDLLVNCTPVGMHPHVDETPIAADDLTGRSCMTSCTTRRRPAC